MVVWAVDESNSVSNLPPATITVVEVLSDLSTSTHSYSTTLQPNKTSSSLKTTTTIARSETNTLSSHISTSFISLTSSTPPFSSTLSPSTSSGTPLLQEPKRLSASALHPGAIAGIVIASITFLIGIFFTTRIWFKRKRVSKLRKTWPRSSHYDFHTPESSYEPKLTPGNGISRGPAQSVQIPSPHVSVPPISYSNDVVLQHPTSPVTPSPSAFISPVYSPGLTFLSPYSTTVTCTFIPSLPDELNVCIGETLRVLTGYEDGWSLCMDCQGKQGMVPNECLEESPFSTGLLPPKPDYRMSRSSTRVTSLAQDVRVRSNR